MNFVLVATLAIIVGIIAIMFRESKTPVATAAAAVGPTVRVQVETVQPAATAGNEEQTHPSLSTREADTIKQYKPVANQTLQYTAAKGDTMANVVAGLLGFDNKQNHDAVIAANPSLQADPDHISIGQTYVVVAGQENAAIAPAAPEPRTVSAPTPQAQIAPAPATAAAPEVAVAQLQTPTAQRSAPAATQPSSDRVLKYTAQPGDSVSALAAGLLGEDSKTNRDAIIGENKSLQQDPDKVVSGKTYKIPTTTGLSAAPVARPTTQPEADRLVQIGKNRELRYVARAGDSVSKLAEILLGSDTAANRDAIINNNASLKSNPDRVVAGETYWIVAPAAVMEKK